METTTITTGVKATKLFAGDETHGATIELTLIENIDIIVLEKGEPVRKQGNTISLFASNFTRELCECEPDFADYRTYLCHALTARNWVVALKGVVLTMERTFINEGDVIPDTEDTAKRDMFVTHITKAVFPDSFHKKVAELLDSAWD